MDLLHDIQTSAEYRTIAPIAREMEITRLFIYNYTGGKYHIVVEKRERGMYTDTHYTATLSCE